MRKRLRKKKHVGEFQEMGFQVKMVGGEVNEDLFDEFLEFLWSNGMEGVVCFYQGHISGTIGQKGFDPSICVCDLRDLTMEWVAKRVGECDFSSLFDMWYEETPDPDIFSDEAEK